MTIADAYKELAQAQKGHARGAPAYSVYVNRRIGRAMAAAAYSIGITPNQVSMISAVHTFIAIGLIAAAPVSWLSGVGIALLLVLGYAWDSADGQVARLAGTGSPQGEWLDHFIDSLKLSSLHVAVAIGLFRVVPAEQSWVLLVPLAFAVTSSTTFAGMLLNDLIKGKNAAPSTHVRGGGTLARSLLLLPTDFGLVCLVFAVWGATTLFLPLYSLLAAVSLIFLALAANKWFREMGALSSAPAK